MVLFSWRAKMDKVSRVEMEDMAHNEVRSALYGAQWDALVKEERLDLMEEYFSGKDGS